MKGSSRLVDPLATNILSLVSGIQVAGGVGFLMVLYLLESPRVLSLIAVIVAGLLFLAASVLSSLVVWDLMDIRRQGDLARFTLLSPEEVMVGELKKDVPLFCIRIPRRSRILSILAADLVTTLLGVVLGVGSTLF